MALTDEQISAVTYYCGPGYRPINDVLRRRAKATRTTTAAVHNIDAAIATEALAEDRILYRGIGKVGADELRAIGIAVGDVLRDPAFLSTSVDPVQAGIFADTPPGGLRMRILAPAGSIALDVSPYSPFPDEHEYLLPRNTGLRIVGFDPATQTIETELVWL